MNINNISFKASYVCPAKFLTKSENKSIFPKKVLGSYVELDPMNQNDVNAICDVSAIWGYFDSLAYDIFDDMERINKNLMRYNEESRFYAITLQKSNFETLEPEKVLGVTEISKKDNSTIKINYLQIAPEQMRGKTTGKFKRLGTTVFNLIKNNHPKNDIYLRSTGSAKKFYEFLGFTKMTDKTNEYIYKAKPKMLNFLLRCVGQ